MPLFEVAIIQKPTKKELEEGTGKETLLFGPEAVLARDKSERGHNRRHGAKGAARLGHGARGGASAPFCVEPRERSRAAVRSAQSPLIMAGAANMQDAASAMSFNDEPGIKYLSSLANTTNYSAASLSAGR